MKAQKPDIFQYQDFREYLKEVLNYCKDYVSGFSLRVLQKEMGLSTHAHYFDVIYGRTLTEKFIPKYIAWLKLSPKEESYFRALVIFDQAKTDREKKAAFSQMVKLSPNLETLQVGAKSMMFFENWINPVLLSTLTLFPSEKNPDKLAKMIRPKATTSEIKKALNVLQKLDMIYWSGSKDEWIFTNRFYKSDDIAKKMILKPYHRKMQELGIFHYDKHYENQKFTSMTLCTTPKTMKKVQQIVEKTRKEIMDVVKQDPEQNLIVQVNLQSFELVKAT